MGMQLEMDAGDFIYTQKPDTEYIHELALCESGMVIPKPNELYRFVIVPNCDSCAKLAAVYSD